MKEQEEKDPEEEGEDEYGVYLSPCTPFGSLFMDIPPWRIVVVCDVVRFVTLNPLRKFHGICFDFLGVVCYFEICVWYSEWTTHRRLVGEQEAKERRRGTVSRYGHALVFSQPHLHYLCALMTTALCVSAR